MVVASAAASVDQALLKSPVLKSPPDHGNEETIKRISEARDGTYLYYKRNGTAHCPYNLSTAVVQSHLHNVSAEKIFNFKMHLIEEGLVKVQPEDLKKS